MVLNFYFFKTSFGIRNLKRSTIKDLYSKELKIKSQYSSLYQNQSNKTTSSTNSDNNNNTISLVTNTNSEPLINSRNIHIDQINTHVLAHSQVRNFK